MHKAISVIILLMLILLLCPASYAANEGYDAAMARGRGLLEENKFDLSAGEFRKAVRERPGDFAAHLHLGISLGRSGSKEAETHLMKALMLEPSDQRTNLELGVYYFSRQVFAEARDYFETALEIGRSTPYAATAEDYLRRLDAETDEKRWSLGLSAGGQYDSNVIVNPSGSPLPEGITRKSDWKALIALNGRFDILNREKTEVSAGYSLYGSLHSKLRDYDIFQQVADLSVTHKLLPPLTFTGAYKFEYVLVGGEEYDNSHTLSPALTLSYGRGFQSELYYNFRYTEFKESELFEGNSDRSGQNHLFGVTQTIPIGGTIKGEVGYAFDRDLARDDAWRYYGNKGFASLTIDLPHSILVGLYGEYYRKRYDGINPASDVARRDEAWTYSASATRFISETAGVTLAETYIHNNSNIDTYRYDRSLTTVVVHVRF
ncbi:MAG: tetratricopeptide repeat protein [Thermodesulfovibrionales bacterium]